MLYQNSLNSNLCLINDCRCLQNMSNTSYSTNNFQVNFIKSIGGKDAKDFCLEPLNFIKCLLETITRTNEYNVENAMSEGL
ncbi:unnamed protein product [Acanthoscelides obtectus]|uniref:Uncharacterized protein n=1 Tax=Acanthoscelides obtectus TaxID=200917 RepID=A0A9P0KW19_ACAOB|nr:unnamed protein product [Acanthoscelides obtectus]CAK1623567.1 hypothetical protein AOBTE_LOCUS2071 [Acanthoscelides obtectus]